MAEQGFCTLSEPPRRGHMRMLQIVSTHAHCPRRSGASPRMGSLCRTSISFDKQTAPVSDTATTGRLGELYRTAEISLKAYVNTTDGGGGDDVMLTRSSQACAERSSPYTMALRALSTVTARWED